MENKLSSKWKWGWVLLTVMAAVISSRMAYIAPLMFIVLYPLAQMISIAFIPNARFPAIWLIHIPYWLIVFSFGFSDEVIFTGMFGSSILGEVLLHFIVKNAKEWKWLLYNSCAIITIILGYKFISSINTVYLNEMIVIAGLGILFGLSALVSLMGIQLEENK